MTISMTSTKIRLILGAALALLITIPAPAQKKKNVNYDESKVGTYTLEDPLTFVNGRKVRNASDWEKRRQEILGIFESEMFGKMPEAMPVYTETIDDAVTLAGFGHRRQVRMWFREDHSGPHIDWLIVTPTWDEGPMPTVIMLNYNGNHALLPDPEIVISEGWFRSSEKFGVEDHHTTDKCRGILAGPQTHDTVYPIGMLLARGYAFVTACYADISPDPDRNEFNDRAKQEAFARSQGVFELWEPADPQRDDNTTSIAAWGWALSRGMDMIEADPLLDQSKVVLTGYSRLAKAALVAGAFDDRFPVVVPVQTGGGGVPLAKRNFGETITTEVDAFPHWFCRAYDKYAGHEDIMPFDQHMLISCVAPRALLVEGFDQGWFDTKGEFLSVQAASPVWKKLGRGALPKGLEWPIPDYDTRAIGDNLGYVRRDNGHGISWADWVWMLDFADRNLGL